MKRAKIMSTLTAILSPLTVGKFLCEAGESLKKMQQITEAAVSAMALAIFFSSDHCLACMYCIHYKAFFKMYTYKDSLTHTGAYSHDSCYCPVWRKMNVRV